MRILKTPCVLMNCDTYTSAAILPRQVGLLIRINPKWGNFNRPNKSVTQSIPNTTYNHCIFCMKFFNHSLRPFLVIPVIVSFINIVIVVVVVVVASDDLVHFFQRRFQKIEIGRRLRFFNKQISGGFAL